MGVRARSEAMRSDGRGASCHLCGLNEGGNRAVKRKAAPVVAAVHDLSCVGRCALTVVLPALAVMGVQPVPLPTAVLSTHTGGLSDMAAQTLASETGAKVYALDPVVTGPADPDEALTYYESVMRQNMQTLQEALGE